VGVDDHRSSEDFSVAARYVLTDGRVDSREEKRVPKRGLGLVEHAGQVMVWGKGAVAGDFVFLSGAEARSSETDEPVEGVKAQTVLALERIEQRLTEAGATLDQVVKFVWYLKDRDLIDDFYEARDGWLASRAPALVTERSYASTLLIVGLAKDDMLVEIDCWAYLG
jgi:enamine deaminase RidA (YjgF/YER057c/UK114 family)